MVNQQFIELVKKHSTFNLRIKSGEDFVRLVKVNNNDTSIIYFGKVEVIPTILFCKVLIEENYSIVRRWLESEKSL